MERMSASGHRVVATFPDLVTAREAIVSLERHGVGGTIQMNRRDEPRGADQDVPTGDAQRARDVRMTGAVGKKAVRGFLIGGLLGGAVAAVVAAFVWDGETSRLAAALTAFLAGGLLFGAIGALISVFASVPNDVEDWERTFDDDPGLPVDVEVISADEHVVSDAAGILQGLSATRTERFDAQGRRLGA